MANSQFADKADVPRPSLSQILNGRNKKISNEFISKLHDAFPSLNVLWLLFGDGEMVNDKNIQFSDSSEPLKIDFSDEHSPEPQNLTNDDCPQNDFSDFRSEKLPHDENCQKTRFSTLSSENQVNDSLFDMNEIEEIDNSTHKQTDLRNSFRPQAAKYTQPDIRPSSDSLMQNPAAQHRQRLQPQHIDTQNAEPYHEKTQYGRHHAGTIEAADRIPLNVDTSKRVAYIMVFYTDNSFEIFRPSEAENK